MAGVARGRLAEERKLWRKDHPPGFVAKPRSLPDGSVDMLTWDCIVPGVSGTDWEGGAYPVIMRFSEDYPSVPPVCYLPKNFFHPNVFPNGAICLSLIAVQEKAAHATAWKPSITHKQILMGIQELLNNPNLMSLAQEKAPRLYNTDRQAYKREVLNMARMYKAKD